MKVLFILLSLLSVKAIASDDAVYGKDVITVLAASCSKDSFNHLLAWANKTGFANQSLSPKNYKVENSKVSWGKTTLQFEENEFRTTIGQQSFAGKDLCELALAIDKVEFKTTQNFFNLILPAANADTKLIDTNASGFLLGGALVTCGGTVVSGATVIWTAGLTTIPFLSLGSACLGFLTGTGVSSHNGDAVRPMQEALNKGMTIFCDSNSITAQADPYKFVLENQNQITYVKSSSGQYVPNDKNKARQKALYNVLSNMRPTCKNAKEAAAWNKRLESDNKEFLTRLASIETKNSAPQGKSLKVQKQ